MTNHNPLDEVVFVKVSGLANGAVTVQGHIGDPKMCIELLQHGIDALKARLNKKEPLILIPNRDVDVKAYDHPVQPIGDMPLEQWGDR